MRIETIPEREARRQVTLAGGKCQVRDMTGIRCGCPAVAATTIDWQIAVCERHAKICEANGFAPVIVSPSAEHAQ